MHFPSASRIHRSAFILRMWMQGPIARLSCWEPEVGGVARHRVIPSMYPCPYSAHLALCPVDFSQWPHGTDLRHAHTALNVHALMSAKTTFPRRALERTLHALLYGMPMNGRQVAHGDPCNLLLLGRAPRRVMLAVSTSSFHAHHYIISDIVQRARKRCALQSLFPHWPVQCECSGCHRAEGVMVSDARAPSGMRET